MLCNLVQKCLNLDIYGVENIFKRAWSKTQESGHINVVWKCNPKGFPSMQTNHAPSLLVFLFLFWIWISFTKFGYLIQELQYGYVSYLKKRWKDRKLGRLTMFLSTRTECKNTYTIVWKNRLLMLFMNWHTCLFIKPIIRFVWFCH